MFGNDVLLDVPTPHSKATNTSVADKFTKEKDLLLIDWVRTNPALYDPSNGLYKDRNYRQKLWADVSFGLGINVSDSKKRWSNLRNSYLRRKKNEMAHGKKSDWDLMGPMSFLSPPLPPTNPMDLYAMQLTKQMFQMNADRVPVLEPPEVLVNEVTKISDENENEGSVEETSETNNRKRTRESTSEDQRPEHIYKFFESMAEVVMQFPPRLAAEARVKVCQIVTELELKMHDFNDRLAGALIERNSF